MTDVFIARPFTLLSFRSYRRAFIMRLVFLFLSIAGSLLSSAQAGVVSYGNFPGSNFSFNNVFESSASIPTPFANLYGAPTSMGNMLIFQPRDFQAARSSTSNGIGTTTTTSQLSVSLLANPGFLITGFAVEELGDYGIAIPFTGASGTIAASLSGTLTSPSGSVPGANSFTQSSNTPPGITGANWNLSIPATSLSPANYSTTASLLVNNSLTATVNAGIADAFIKKKGFKITVSTAPGGGGNIPEPTSALVFLVMGTAGLPLYRRR